MDVIHGKDHEADKELLRLAKEINKALGRSRTRTHWGRDLPTMYKIGTYLIRAKTLCYRGMWTTYTADVLNEKQHNLLKYMMVAAHFTIEDANERSEWEGHHLDDAIRRKTPPQGWPQAARDRAEHVRELGEHFAREKKQREKEKRERLLNGNLRTRAEALEFLEIPDCNPSPVALQILFNGWANHYHPDKGDDLRKMQTLNKARQILLHN